ncbi:hypothetical protein Mal48_02920 [Thalassoglobus polymorphus]|uniref:Uncharacterized protein n=1 Tax=Thalassoglobus polymorphus TaxID=2527994 RepID=A0A517QHF8_9PLAN|nr:hypothetical protein Mal48_02920 [Thalassoglobus polymorphus]
MKHFDGVGYRQLTDQFVGDLRRCVNKIDNTKWQTPRSGEFWTNKKFTEFIASFDDAGGFPERLTQPIVGSRMCGKKTDTQQRDDRRFQLLDQKYPFGRNNVFISLKPLLAFLRPICPRKISLNRREYIYGIGIRQPTILRNMRMWSLFSVHSQYRNFSIYRHGRFLSGGRRLTGPLVTCFFLSKFFVGRSAVGSCEN